MRSAFPHGATGQEAPGPGRSKLFGNSADEYLKVHHRGPSDADITERSGGIWERLTYDWSDRSRVVMKATDSKLWGGNSGHTYAFTRHLPLIKRRMGMALKYYTIDKGVSAERPASPPAYVAMCHLICDSVESYQSSFGPHAQEHVGDIPHFTDQTPVTQISEVVVENSSRPATPEPMKV